MTTGSFTRGDLVRAHGGDQVGVVLKHQQDAEVDRVLVDWRDTIPMPLQQWHDARDLRVIGWVSLPA